MAWDSYIEKEIKSNDIIVFLIPKNNYGERLKDFAKVSTKSLGSICYVSLNKPYSTLVPMFQKMGIDTQGIVFIDAAKTGFGDASGNLRVVSVSSPKALTELDIAIQKVIIKENVKGIVFDSLSTLLVYEEPSNVIKFSHSVISKMRSGGTKGIFMCLKDDVESELIKDLSMFVDKVVEVQ